MKDTRGGPKQQTTSKGEKRLAGLSAHLVRTDLAWMGHGLLKVLRLAWPDRPVQAEHVGTAETPEPKGPFKTTRPEQVGDLLVWTPRRMNSYLIDDLTGGYGYSHTTVDTGEVEVPTGKPVMAEITVGQTVRRKYIGEYGERPYVRIPLVRAGVDVQQLVKCVQSKMGEQYDAWDALTLGEIEDPAKEVCSGLVADCLPDESLREIARVKKLGLLHRGSVSIHSKLDAPKMRVFVSPNGFAEYYGAPKGRKVTSPDTVVQPRPVNGSVTRLAGTVAKRHGWKVAAAIVALLTFGLIVRRRW